MCGEAGHTQMRMGPTDADCTTACVLAHGAQYVLFDGKNVYVLSDQKSPEEYAGRKVRVVGTLDAATKTIRVESMAAAEESAALLSAGAMEPAVLPLLAQFEAASGHAVSVQFGTAPELVQRLSRDEPGDLLIAPKAVMDQAVAAMQATAATRVAIGRIGVGAFVRRGAPLPDVSTPERLRDAILGAGAVVYTQGSSGQYFDTVLATLGVEAQVRPRVVRTPDAEAALARIAAGGERDLGFGAITAIKAHEAQGTHYVAPLPAQLQNFTVYEAAIRAGARAPTVGKALLDFIQTPAARATLRSAGVE
jgi:molybdate transport system substrate-binding protein